MDDKLYGSIHEDAPHYQNSMSPFGLLYERYAIFGPNWHMLLAQDCRLETPNTEALFLL